MNWWVLLWCIPASAAGFEIMRRERITEALAFDGDFAAAGFVEARPVA